MDAPVRLPRTISDWEDARRRIRLFVGVELRIFDPDLRLTAVSEEALRIVDGWNGRRYPHSDWRRLVQSEGRSRMEAAIWSGATLCGLVFGRVKPDCIEIARIEGHPGPMQPLKGRVVDIAIACGEMFAIEVGLDEVRIEAPISALLAIYARRGYTRVVRRGHEIDYVAKSLGGSR